MCTVCGCGPDQVHIDGQAPGHFNYRALGRKPAATAVALLRRRLCRPVKGRWIMARGRRGRMRRA
jgi:hypothetical protein